MNDFPTLETMDPLLDQRYRFLKMLSKGQDVFDFFAVLPIVPANLVLDLTARSASDLVENMDNRLAALAPGGILVLAEATSSGTGSNRLRTLLGKHFNFVVTFQQRRLEGSVLCSEREAASRILTMAEAIRRAPVCLLHLASDKELPVLTASFLEIDGSAPAPLWPEGLSYPSPSSRISPETDLAARGRAVGLVERLVAYDAALLAKDTEIGRLQRAYVMSSPTTGRAVAGAETSSTQHSWPLADHRNTDRAFYNNRVDDAVLLEGDAGVVFLHSFRLLGTAPDHVNAVAALNAHPAAILSQTPDVSIVIPVHGALGYTLNCLDSLFKLAGRSTAEIIIVDDASPDDSANVLGGVAGISVLRQSRNGGFIASCNIGAKEARGKLVVFLNNDTRVVSGWLDTLVESFDLFPKAGLVGSKMLYPDGALQEAGGIIWRDGSCWNYGRNDDPNRPEYCHARQVDYISGCSIAIPTALFHETGGFDTYFAPAYCEDADLALRIRAAGHEVWFQPQSRIVHYEGRTGGTDTGSGVKAYQVINGAKLALRWRDRLLHHRPNAEAPLLERERTVLRRALIIDASTPTPRMDAGSVTTTLTLKLFHDLGYKAHFVPQDNFLFQPGYTTDLLQSGIEVAYAPYDTDFEDYLGRSGRCFDVVLVYRVTVLEKVIDALRRLAPQAPILFHNMDLHFLRMQRQARLEDDSDALAEADAMQVHELALIGRVDCTITHSTYERDLLRVLVPDAPVVVFPFMFEFQGTEIGFSARRDFCFLGGYNHAPNVDAVTFFAQEVLPLIHLQEPNARFIVAGANPSLEVLALACDHVIVTGQIDDLRDVFDSARVFACSLRIGAGTKGKVSTAMSYGMPVVSTACGAEGMDLLDGENVLLADSPADFAAACLRAYRDPALWQRLSDNGQQLVREKHSLAMGRSVLEMAIDTGLRHHLGLEQRAS